MTSPKRLVSDSALTTAVTCGPVSGQVERTRMRRDVAVRPRDHAERAQQHRRRIWWLESEDLGQHLGAGDLELPMTLGLVRFLKHFLCCGRHAEAIFFRDVSDPRLLRHGAHRQRGSVGAGTQAQGAQGFAIERVEGLASLLQAHAQHGFDRGILEQCEQDVIGASSAITSATSLLTGPQIDGPGVKHLWRNGFGGHDDSLLYFVCTDWRVTPKASPICCHDQPFSRADLTWSASTRSARRWSANEARSPTAGSSDAIAEAMSSAFIGRQSRLTTDVCQPKLTPRGFGTIECPVPCIASCSRTSSG